MKLKKKNVMIIAGTLLTLTLAACGSNNDETTDDPYENVQRQGSFVVEGDDSEAGSVVIEIDPDDESEGQVIEMIDDENEATDED